MIDIDTLKKFKILKGLNERELETVAKLAKKRIYEAGARIFEEKALATHLYLVLEGKIEVKVRCIGSEQIKIDEIGPGRIFGWSAVTEPYTFTAATWAVEQSEVIVFEGRKLRDLFANNNHIGYRVVKEVAAVISGRLKRMEAKFIEIVCKENASGGAETSTQENKCGME
jgi:CRP/FNR family cyclic AMP-dependent transcriptional regulator